MKDIFKRLSMLQKVLERYFELEKEIETLPRELSDRAEMLLRKKEEYVKTLSQEERLKDRVAALEKQYADAKVKREEQEIKSSHITTQREFELNQIELTKAKETEHHYYNLREETKRKAAALNEKSSEILDELNAIQKMVEDETATINSRLDELKAEKDALETKKAKYSKDIEPTLLFKFERIVKTKGGGSVAVKGRVCQGCHMELPVQFVNTVRKGETVEFCPYCSRVLYYQEGDDDEIDALKMDDILLDDDDDIDERIDGDIPLSVDDDDASLIATEDEFDF